MVVILVVGLVLRSYKALQLFQYSHDQDLLGWFVRDVVVNQHLRLVGQETSSHGVFIGPFFYYLTIPFYFLTKMDPAGTLLLSIIFGGAAIGSVYFVLKEIVSRRVGLIGALVYALSVLIVFTDREVDPTMPVMLWTIWYLFALARILKGQKYGYLIVGLLVGLIWSLNLQFIILLPLILVAQILSKKRINFKELVVGVGIAVVLNIPFMAFEARHGFQQTKAIFASLTTSKDYVAGTATGLAKVDRVMQLVYKNTTNLFGANVLNTDVKIVFWLLVLGSVYLMYTKKIKWFGIMLVLWQAIYILFFSKVSLNISEYYLNGMNIVWILIFAAGVDVVMQNKNKIVKTVGYLAIGLFVVVNVYSFTTRPVNADGYIERKAVIEYIKTDAAAHNYPCVSLSFITSPGNNLGYRYFTWELGLKTKPISTKVPVYSIVFPHSMVDRIDKSFGALGLVLPDYKRYNDNVIQKVCEGADFTTTEPMFGFTN